MELLDGKTGLGAAGLTVLSEAEVSYAKHPGVRFPRYAVLGDDVLIADTCVSQVYEQGSEWDQSDPATQCFDKKNEISGFPLLWLTPADSP
ncbi:hypothetical protein OIU78_014697 [Salix suchowensis]|nr:hypothetical protein OIU78_014697 [Salix suchowensis]